ncbi:hypothetical protein M885DRAFT_505829 [Pelagophyceae sp. CCMP2097]|nr:hypothetical protein M885DRAFT_505829 [Pelagophyceae sp. CCMP2097]|mmetsp:Transcript_2506/g.8823  ORF Transcript_2506/g.8823 Transcript_2506/m.8823 type:complete len:528 (+) Transcript_2506:1258-2841(+)
MVRSAVAAMLLAASSCGGLRSSGRPLRPRVSAPPRGGGLQAAAVAADAAVPQRAKVSEPCNVVLTTTNADFDSLAAACALAALWTRGEDAFAAVPTHVVMPRGACPQVSRFLAYHKHVLPVRGFKTIDAEDVRALGVVDASSAERLGRATKWLDKAHSVHVFDHHMPDADAPRGLLERVATELVVEAVGSTTTLLVERLRARGIVPKGAEATLYVLGIRADTGGLVYESTTTRDAEALCWLLGCGASQAAVAEFGVERVSPGQRDCLAEALAGITTTEFRGIKIATVAVRTPDFVPGLAIVAEELLALTAADVLIMAAEHSGSWIDVIGRARPRAVTVDLRAVMRAFGGGGHKSAAAASLSLGNGTAGAYAGASDVIRAALEAVMGQIPAELHAKDFMTKYVVTLNSDTATIAEAKDLFELHDLKSLVVVDGDNRLRGVLKLSDAVKAEKRGEAEAKVKGCMRSKVATVGPEATVAELEAILVLQGIGRLPVVAEDLTLLGIVTRTDILRLRNFYEELDESSSSGNR